MIPAHVVSHLHGCTRLEANQAYDKLWDQGWVAIRELCLVDRFFLLVWVLGRADANRDWIYARCREVEASPDEHLDLWAREHYKSTLITFAGSIQEILKNPEITICIFSHTRPIAKKFLLQVKREFEDNQILKRCFPEICWQNPKKEAPVWSEDGGIVLKRKTNPKESTLQAYGLVDGMPTSAHYRLRIYNDVVTKDSVTTPEMIEKTTDAWKLSQDLGTEGGRRWHEGTRYHFNDTYRHILDSTALEPRIYPATDDATPNGKPVLFSAEYIRGKRDDQGPYVFACQQLLNPVADEVQGFKREWLRYYTFSTGEGMNRYILVDPANEKKKYSDYTAIFVIGLNSDSNYYVLDLVRDRLNLTERANKLFDLHRRWKPLAVGYEKYGKDSDIAHFQDRMNRENYRFDIVALGGQTKKEDRIRKMIPICEQHRLYLPEVLFYDDYEGKKHELVKEFIEQEYLGFPVATHEGTRYHFNDTYRHILDSTALEPRIYPATDDATPNGKPVLFSAEYIRGKRDDQGPYVFACQQLLNPVADEVQGFKREWLRYYTFSTGEGMNRYILVDPANEKKKYSDYTAIFVIGLNSDSNYYVLDLVRDRLNLTERANKLFDLHRRWKPLAVGYEKYGKDSDIAHFQDRMNRENYRFDIVALGGQTKKEDRIRKMIPICEQHRLYLPEVLFYDDYEGKKHELVKEFIEQEYLGFPVATHDDMLDCLARIRDPDFYTMWPDGAQEEPKRDRYAPKRQRRSWMAA